MEKRRILVRNAIKPGQKRLVSHAAMKISRKDIKKQPVQKRGRETPTTVRIARK